MKFRWIYVLSGIIIMICLGTVYSWSVFRISVEKYYDVGTTHSGLPYMAALAFYALFMFITGSFLDRYHPRLFIFVGGLVVSVGWIASSFATNIYMLTFTYGIVGGAGVGIAYGAPISVVTKWFPEKKGLAVGLVLVGFGVSPLITAPLARLLIENYGIMHTFFLLGIIFGCVTSITSFLIKNPSINDVSFYKAEKLSASFSNLNTANMVRSKSFIGLYLNFIIGTMIGLMLVGMTSNISVELIGLPRSTTTWLMTFFALFNGVGRPLFGWITDKTSPKYAMYISYVLIICASILMLFSGEGSTAMFVIAFSIFWLNLGGWLSIAPTTTIRNYGIEHYSQNYGVVFTAYGIGAIIGVLTSGVLIDIHGNYHFIFYLIIALSLFGSVITSKYCDNH